MGTTLREPTRDPLALPRFTDADFRTTRAALIRSVAQDEADERITREDSERRITVLTAHRTDLAPAERADAIEQLRSALARLAHVRSDMWDPAEGDRLTADLDADDDAENAINKLVGGRK